MENVLKSTVLFLLLFFLFNSCTIQKKRYSSGFHISWHHHKGTKVALHTNKVSKNFDYPSKHKEIALIQEEEKIDLLAFSNKYPTTPFNESYKIELIRYHPGYPSSDMEISYNQPSLDTQTVLSEAEIDNNYFISQKGEKKKFRKGLRLGLIIAGLALLFTPIFYVGIPAIIVGFLLPHPSPEAQEVSTVVKEDYKKGNTLIKVALIIVGVIILAILIFLIAWAIEGDGLVGF